MHGEILVIGLTLLAALGGGRLATRLGYPSVLGELLVGIAVGPPLLGLLQPSEPLAILGEFGVLLMMVLIGMHLDPSDIRTASTPGLLAAAGGFLVPAGLGFGLMVVAGRSGMEALFVGLAMGVTSLATKSRILVDLKILDTRIAHVLMAAALISDVAVLVIFSAVVGQGGVGAGAALITTVQAIAFLVGAILLGKVVIPRIAARAPHRPDGATAYLLVVITALLFAWLAELAGLHAILGGFIGGLFLSERVIGARTSREVRNRLTTVAMGTLAPLFFVSAGFQVTVDVFRTDLGLLVGVVVLATVGKIFGTALTYSASGNGWREGLVLGAGMNGRGAVEIIVAELALRAGLIDQTVFSILVFMAIFTTATVPVLLTKGVTWLRRRGELVRAGERTGILIAGAQPLARVVARLLRPSGAAVLVDTNRSNVETGSAEGLDVIYGNALDVVALRQAGIEEAGIFVAATVNPEVNLLAAQAAHEHGVPEIVVAMTCEDAAVFAHQIAELQAEVLVLPRDLAAWDQAITTGLVEEITFRLDDPELVEQDPEVTEGIVLPLIGGTGDSRRLYTTRALLQAGEPVVALRRSASPVGDDDRPFVGDRT